MRIARQPPVVTIREISRVVVAIKAGLIILLGKNGNSGIILFSSGSESDNFFGIVCQYSMQTGYTPMLITVVQFPT